MPSIATPLVVTVMHTDHVDIPRNVLTDELRDVIVPFMNVQKHRIAFRGDRQIIFALHKVPKIEDGTVDLAVYIAGSTDPQVSVDHGLRKASILTALHLLYDNTEISVVINNVEVSVTTPMPRIEANGFDNFLKQIQVSCVDAVMARRLRADRQRETDAERFSEVTNGITVPHSHKPGTPVAYYI